ncbi:MAG TPA: immunoglobulin domain-containing protein, partial [Verrucomicrobiota bacterium]|nr:immunoglobulin domain-containing protein [Verrucomicrobiota bacterium]
MSRSLRTELYGAENTRVVPTQQQETARVDCSRINKETEEHVMKNHALGRSVGRAGLAFAVLISAIGGFADCTPPPSGAVAWWPAEGNAYDIAGSNHGTIVGDIGFVPGVAGQGMSFAGTQYVVVPDSPPLRPTSITIEGWFKLGRNSGTMVLVSKAFGSQDANSVELWLENGRPAAGVNCFGAPYCGHITSTMQLMAGQWCHLAFTFDDAAHELSLYVNGIRTAMGYCDHKIQYDDHPFLLGMDNDSGKLLWGFEGVMDEVTIYDRALSGQEIRAIHLARNYGKCRTACAPRILVQPNSKQAVLGQIAVDFEVAAGANPPASFQWRKDEVDLLDTGRITGVNSSRLTIKNVQPTDVGVYTVVVSNDLGSVVSDEVTLTIVQQPECVFAPMGLIAWWPFDGSGEDIASGNNGGGDAARTYEEGKVGKAIICDYEHYIVVPDSPALRPDSFTIEGWVKFDRYLHQTLISKGLGTGSDKSFSITFRPDYVSAGINRFYPTREVRCEFPYEIGRWYHLAFSFDDSAHLMALYIDGTLRGTATCAASVMYDDNPLVIGADINGSQLTGQLCGQIDELTLYNRALSAEEIRAIYQAGSSGKCRAKLNPRILVEPTSQRVVAGETMVKLEAEAFGEPAPSYQWMKDGASLADGDRISGARTPTLVIRDVRSADAGIYVLVVSNFLGVVTSCDATLTVTEAPVLLVVPRSQTVYEGSNPVLSVVAEGNGPFTYQWQKNGVDIPGETYQSLFFLGARPQDSGEYTVRVRGPGGTETTASAVLTVKPMPEDSAAVFFGLRYFDFRMIGLGWSGEEWTNIVAVETDGSNSYALRRDGTPLYSFGPAGIWEPPSGLSNVVAISAAGHVINLKRDGTVVEWAAPFNQPPGLSNIVAVSAGASYSLALKKDGTVIGWGANDAGQAVPPAGLSGVVAIAACYAHSLALKADGTVVAWGDDIAGQCCVPPGLSNVVAIAAGMQGPWGFSLALRQDGTVVAWGANDFGQCNPPPDLRDVVAISAGEGHALALKKDGTVVGWGDMSLRPGFDLSEPAAWVPPTLKDVVAISAGGAANLALTIGPPVVVTQPVSSYVTEGGSAYFNVNAYGAGIGYQWYHDDVPIPGATNMSLVVSNVVAVHEGGYKVVVINAHGFDTSRTVSLTLNTGEPGS